MSVTALRKEMYSYIDTIPEYRLKALKPLLADLAEPDFVIETDLTDEERAIIAEGEKLFEEHPEDFISLKDFFKEVGISYEDTLVALKNEKERHI